MAHPLAFEPERTTVAVDDVPHGQWRGVGADAHRVHLPAHHGLGAHHLPGPHQIQVGAGLGDGQAQLDPVDAEFIGQPGRQVGQRLHQRKTVDLEPQRGVDRVAAHLQRAQRLDAPRDGRHQVRAAHVLHRPAGLEAAGGAVGQVLHTGAQGGGLLAHHAQETRVHRGIQIGIGQHLHRGLQVGQGPAAALGHAVQQLVAQGLLLELARHVVEHQHEATQHRPRRVEHGRHLHPQQLAVAGGGDKLRRGLGRTARHALADGVQCMVHQRTVEHGVDRAPQADRCRAVAQFRHIGQGTELQARAVVVQQHTAVQVADHDTLGELGHQGRQAPTFVVDLLAGLLHLALHVVLQQAALSHQRLDRACQAAHLGAAGIGQCPLGAAGQLDAGLLVQAGDGLHMVPEQALRQQGEHHAADQPGHQDQRHARLQHLGHQGAFRCRQRGPHHAGRHGDPHAQHQSGGRRRQRRTLRELHAAPASRARTWATRSLVENGLVT